MELFVREFDSVWGLISEHLRLGYRLLAGLTRPCLGHRIEKSIEGQSRFRALGSGLISGLLLVSVASSTFSASVGDQDVYRQPDCSKRVDMDGPRVTGIWGSYSHNARDKGMPLSEPVLVRGKSADGKGHHLFRMPAGYLAGRGTVRNVGRLEPGGLWAGGAAWVFWMPDLRFSESIVGEARISGPYRCEHGRPQPSPDAYLVYFQVGAVLKRFNKLDTPMTIWRRRFAPSEAVEKRLANGLIVATRGRDIDPATSHFLLPEGPSEYRNDGKDGYEYMINCSDPITAACRAKILQRERNLYIEIQLERRRMEHWFSIFEAVKTFLEQWSVESQAAPFQG